MKKPLEKLLILTECALMVALAVVLDLLPLPKWPNGGSVSVAMIPIIFLSFRRGTKWGLATGLVFSVIQMLLGWYAPPANTIGAVILCVLLDYVLAFTVIGTANAFAFPKKNAIGYGVGAAVVCVLRFVCSFISGFVLWGSYADPGMPAWLYSLTYNAGYMLPNALISAVVLVLLTKIIDPKTLRRPAA